MLKRIALVLALAASVVSGAQAASETIPRKLDLRSACALAVRHNPNLSGAAAAADVAGSLAEKARSGLYPSVVVRSGYNYLSKETQFGGTPVLEQNTLQNDIQLRQVIYSGGRVGANIAQADRGHAAARWRSEAARAEVMTQTAVAYLRARQAKDAIAVAQDTVRSLEANLDAARKLFEAGTVTKSDVLRSEVALTSARAELISAENRYGIALANLKTAIGLPQTEPVEVSDEPVDDALDTATHAPPTQRPEVSANAEAVRAAEAAARGARAEKLPTALLVADYFNEPEGSQFPRRSNSIGAGLVVQWNVFDGGLTSAGIREAEAAVRKARQDLESTKRLSELELETAKLDADSALARLATTGTQVTSAEESLRALRAGYNEGITPLTDVLAAETALTEARTLRLLAAYDVKIAQVNLLRALGRTDSLLSEKGGK
jgi:outer membrane protein